MRSGISWLSRWTSPRPSPRPRLETELKSDQIRAPIAATTLCGGTERGRRSSQRTPRWRKPDSNSPSHLNEKLR